MSVSLRVYVSMCDCVCSYLRECVKIRLCVPVSVCCHVRVCAWFMCVCGTGSECVSESVSTCVGVYVEM